MGAKIQILQKLIAARVIGERVRGGKRKFKGLRVANFNSTYYRGGVAEARAPEVAHTVLVSGSPATSNSISSFLTTGLLLS
jgi:hypothetical protein